jgi:hypothetical protein
MSCSECPHCKINASRSALRLAGPPGNYGSAGIDMAFYMSFGRAYDRARALGPQPMRQLRDVNPWLTASQCKSYLKRARALGQVQASGRTRVTAVDGATPGKAKHPLAGTALEDAWQLGYPIARQALLRFVCGGDEKATDALLEDLVAHGGIRTGDDVQAPQPVAG